VSLTSETAAPTTTRLPRLALALSAALLVLAPLALPSSYSWIEHTTSESGAQGVDGAWMARAAFVLFAVGVAGIVVASRRRWNPWAMVAHSAFAACMITVALFSTRSWVDDAPYESTEELVHSVAATVMGFAFALGVVAVAVGRRAARPIDVAAVTASVLVPLSMTALVSTQGLLQRVMFAVAYLWYWSQTSPNERLADSDVRTPE
jgi:Protein of unknown function (DUF998)